MPKYLTMVSYTPEGIKGLVKEGGTARRAAVEKMLQNLGGRLEGFYFAFGDNDAYVISEGPDNATAAAISLAITTGAIRTKTIVLLTPEEVDRSRQDSRGLSSLRQVKECVHRSLFAVAQATNHPRLAHLFGESRRSRKLNVER